MRKGIALLQEEAVAESEPIRVLMEGSEEFAGEAGSAHGRMHAETVDEMDRLPFERAAGLVANGGQNGVLIGDIQNDLVRGIQDGLENDPASSEVLF